METGSLTSPRHARPASSRDASAAGVPRLPLRCAGLCTNHTQSRALARASTRRLLQTGALLASTCYVRTARPAATHGSDATHAAARRSGSRCRRGWGRLAAALRLRRGGRRPQRRVLRRPDLGRLYATSSVHRALRRAPRRPGLHHPIARRRRAWLRTAAPPIRQAPARARWARRATDGCSPPAMTKSPQPEQPSPAGGARVQRRGGRAGSPSGGPAQPAPQRPAPRKPRVWTVCQSLPVVCCLGSARCGELWGRISRASSRSTASRRGGT